MPIATAPWLPGEPTPATKKRRRVVQIAAAGGEMYALCSDGSVWGWFPSGWYLLPMVPQREITEIEIEP
jgi:hypothetical protein